MICEVTEKNIAQAGFVHSESWKKSHKDFCSEEFIAKHTPEAQADYLRREMAVGKQLYLLMEDGPVGIVSVQENLIENLYVLPAMQNRGYGGKLLHFAMERCTGTPTLWVLNTNKGAYRLYARNGFAETGSRKMLKNGMFETEMQYSRLNEIRRAEALSHTESYNHNVLFQQGSWLSRPVKTVLELLPLFENYREFRALDLGCGVGRNCIPVAQAVSGGTVDCVDILELAIEKLRQNAAAYGVADRIHTTLSGIDSYVIPENTYDLILGISVLEHMDSRESMQRKVREIRDGVRENGAVCFVLNTGIREHDKATGEALQPQFEVLMDSAEILELFNVVFAGWQVLHSSVRHQKYDTPRERGTVELDSDVVTFAARKE